MFDLAFCRTVRIILDWQEAPPSVYLNDHQSMIGEKKDHRKALDHFAEKFLQLDPAERHLRLYVWSTYPQYFGLTLRTSGDQMSTRCYVGSN